MNAAAGVFSVKTLALSLLLILLLISSGGWFRTHVQPQVPSYLQGMGANFTLQSSSGPLALHDLQGKVVLLYFGYTHCPDACPQALTLITRAMRQLSPLMQQRVASLFISIDPHRDTPDILEKYCSFFDSRIIGVTGDPQSLAHVAKAWRVNYQLPKQPTTKDYIVSHSTFIYLLDPMGRTVAIFGDHSSATEIASQIKIWMSKTH